MPSFEEEAFNRAQQMHRKPQFNREAPRREVPKQPEKQEESKSEIPEPPVPKKDDGLLNLMFKNKEQSLILFACDTAYGGKHRSVSSACADVSFDVIIGFVRFL